jgi:hypothetical protein
MDVDTEGAGGEMERAAADVLGEEFKRRQVDVFNWTTVIGAFRTEYDPEDGSELQRFRRDPDALYAVRRLLQCVRAGVGRGA